MTFILIKKFTDDSGHTTAKLYTDRTVVHLMTRVMELVPGESAYDPNGDTLAAPKFLEYDRLKQFNVTFANPPYSIKK